MIKRSETHILHNSCENYCEFKEFNYFENSSTFTMRTEQILTFILLIIAGNRLSLNIENNNKKNHDDS